MSTIEQFFIKQKLENGFVLLIFRDFDSCIEFFKQNAVMQKHVFFGVEGLLSSVPDLPSSVAIIAPTIEHSFDLWEAVTRGSGAMLEKITNQPTELLKTARVVENKEFAFLFSPIGAEALGLN